MTDRNNIEAVEPPNDIALAVTLRTTQGMLDDVAFGLPRGHVTPAQCRDLADLLDKVAQMVRARAEVTVFERKQP